VLLDVKARWIESPVTPNALERTTARAWRRNRLTLFFATMIGVEAAYFGGGNFFVG
jgi:hypothetical protein